MPYVWRRSLRHSFPGRRCSSRRARLSPLAPASPRTMRHGVPSLGSSPLGTFHRKTMVRPHVILCRMTSSQVLTRQKKCENRRQNERLGVFKVSIWGVSAPISSKLASGAFLPQSKDMFDVSKCFHPWWIRLLPSRSVPFYPYSQGTPAPQTLCGDNSFGSYYADWCRCCCANEYAFIHKPHQSDEQ